MTAILLTGMSGAGKSTILAELALRGHETVETDDGDWCHDVGGELLWDERAIDALLRRPRTGALFVSGTVPNQGGFYARFAAIVLVTAPREVLLARIAARTTNAFGKDPAERARIEGDIAEVEPLLRRGATHVLATTGTVDDAVERLLAIAAV